MLLQLAAIVAVAVLLAAAASDIATRRIPNWTVVAVVGLFVLGVPAAPPISIPWGSLAVAAGVLATGFLAFCLGGLGAGDAKLLAATALWAGPDHGLATLFLVAVLGGGVALVVVALRNVVTVRILVERTAGRTIEVPGNVPYGVAVAAGGIFAALTRSGLLAGG